MLFVSMMLRQTNIGPTNSLTPILPRPASTLYHVSFLFSPRVICFICHISFIMNANEMRYFSHLFDKVLYTFRTGPLRVYGVDILLMMDSGPARNM